MSEDIFDLIIIGGGINGCGIARDAAGRGWRVLLAEKGDLAGATSSASTKLIHGGLRYLEHFKFRLVREALMEREVLWGIAPHIIWPLRFVLPHHKGLRPAWLLRLGLFLYDHLGGRKRLPATRTLRLDRDPAGKVLRPEFTTAFEYSDCWVEDSRLVVLNARAAADLGAEILTRTACVAAQRRNGVWQVTLEGGRVISARALVNAAGPWVADVAGQIMHANAGAKIRLVQGSHIVVKRIFEHDRCYFFQNSDLRIFFAIPYEQNFTLIGTTDQDYHGDPGKVAITQPEIDYLCAGASAYFLAPIVPSDVIWSYSGARALYDDGASAAQEATRDYVLELDAPADLPAGLSVYGGKITTYRRLAEAALAKLAPHLPTPSGQKTGWTGKTALPGGDFPIDGFAALLTVTQARYPFVPPALAHRLLRAYGTRIDVLLAGKTDLGRNFGADLTEAEVCYLITDEFARSADDIVWRRSKLGLRLTPDQIAEIDRFVKDQL